jgi:hypothetical protein
MTTPSITSPNVRILVPEEAPVPADDSNLRGPTPGEIQPAFVAEIFDSALKDEADHATALAIAGQDMVAEWWEGVEERVYLGPFMFPRPRTVTPTASAGRFPAAASPPAGPSVPVAKLSIVVASVAEPVPEPVYEISPGAFITEVVTGAPGPAAEQEAAEEPDATAVIPVAEAETAAVPAVKEEGEPDA